MQFQNLALVLQTEQLTAEIFRITLEAPEIAREARPGQFVMVRIGLAGHDPLLRRPLSIHQIMPEGRLQLLYKVVGKGTRLLAALTPGSMVDLLGPLGRGFTMPNPGEQVCLVGGGMGAAPLLFLLRAFAGHLPPHQVRVLLGARNEAELGSAAEMETLGYQVSKATDDGSVGHQGFVVDLLESALNHAQNWRVYTCGPYPMMRAVAQICHLHGWKCQVSLETHMACGVGVCLGCALPRRGLTGYLHVCKDGPVLDAYEIAWF